MPKGVYERPDDLQRLFRKMQVDFSTGCWLCSNSLDGEGYARVGSKKAHRLVLLQSKGAPPNGKPLACHACDVRNCINPAHLFWGSNEDNQLDKVEKDRQAKGDRNGRALLTETQAKEIRHGIFNGLRQVDIGKMYGVSQLTVSNIRTGKTWRHI